MTADILATLRADGFALRAEGGRVLVSPASRLTEAQRRTIRAHKAPLLRLLEGCPDCHGPLRDPTRCWKCGWRPCERCGRVTSSAFLALCLACDLGGVDVQEEPDF